MSSNELADLRARLSYNPDTGLFTWISVTRRCDIKRIGTVAGSISLSHGYVEVGVGNKSYLAHRLAYLFMRGHWPEAGLQIDHIDGNRTNNKWSNLRLCTNAENSRNSKVRHLSGASKVKGVRQRSTGAWMVQVTHNYTNYYGGQFATKAEAEQAAINLRLRLHKEFCNHGY